MLQKPSLLYSEVFMDWKKITLGFGGKLFTEEGSTKGSVIDFSVDHSRAVKFNTIPPCSQHLQKGSLQPCAGPAHNMIAMQIPRDTDIYKVSKITRR